MFVRRPKAAGREPTNSFELSASEVNCESIPTSDGIVLVR